MGKINVRKGAVKAKNFLDRNGSLILLITSIATGVTSTVMAVKAAPVAKELLEEVKKNAPEDISKPALIWEETKAIAPVMWPAALMGTASVASTVGIYCHDRHHIAKLSGALALKTNELQAYQKKFIENYGEKKMKRLQEDVISDKVKEKESIPEPANLNGRQLCYDVCSERLFWSSPGDIETALLRTSTKMHNWSEVSLNNYYQELDNDDLVPCYLAEDYIWDANRDHLEMTNIDVSYSSHLTKDNKTALAVSFSPMPKIRYSDM